MQRVRGLTGLLLAAALMTSGCTSGNPGPASSADTTSPRSSASGTPTGGTSRPGTSENPARTTSVGTTGQGLPSGVTPASSIPTAPSNVAAKRNAVAVTKCAASDGGWTATGTAQNTAATATTFRITVFFANEGGTVINFAETTVKVDPGKTGRWTAGQKFTAPRELSCIIRAVS